MPRPHTSEQPRKRKHEPNFEEENTDKALNVCWVPPGVLSFKKSYFDVELDAESRAPKGKGGYCELRKFGGLQFGLI